MGNTILQRLHLCINTHLGGRQSGNSHLHLDKLHPTRLLCLGSHLLHFADGSLGKVSNAEVADELINQFFLNWCLHYFRYYVITLYRYYDFISVPLGLLPTP